MTIEYLSEVVELPYNRAAITSGDPEQLADYLYELTKALERSWLQDIHTTVNLILDLGAGDWLYFSIPDPEGVYPDGSWRIGVNSDGLEMQRLTSGVWVKASRTTT